MARFAAVHWCLALALLIPSAALPQDRPGVAPVGRRPPSQHVKRSDVLKELDRIKADLKYRERHLGSPVLHLPGFMSRRGVKECADIDRAIHVASQDLHLFFASNGLWVLNDYVEQEFDALHFDKENCLEQYRSGNGELSAKELFEKMQTIIARVRSLPSLRIDLRVTTMPPGAFARFYLRNHPESEREVITDDTAGGLDVGRYVVKVQKEGHQPVAVPINLVDNPIDLITCTLRKDGEPEQSACKQRRKAN